MAYKHIIILSVIYVLTTDSHIFRNLNPFNILKSFRNKNVTKLKCSESDLVDSTNGLKNLGNICYLNSVIQGLYHCYPFRKQIISIEKTNERSNNNVFNILSSSYQKLSLPFQDNINLGQLTKYMKIDVSIQEDAQEFYLKLLDKMESDIKLISQSTAQSGQPLTSNSTQHIPSLFTGKFENYIQCKHVSFEKKKIQKFKDLSIEITPTLYQSIEKLLIPELLQGSNQYKTEEYGKQDAYKGVKIVELPPILVFQLNRFTFDYSIGNRFKVTDKLEFPVRLNMTPYFNTTTITMSSSSSSSSSNDYTTMNKLLSEKGDEEYMYELKSIIIHIGSADYGHYICISRPDIVNYPNQWIKLDDSHVTAISWDEVQKMAYGGRPFQLAGIREPVSSDAYMLLYERK